MAERALRRAAQVVFRSVGTRNFRLFFVGQFVSGFGMWVQRAAELWLVLSITSSPIAVGAVTAFGFGPVLLLGPWAGLIADRRDRRRLLMWTQTARCLPALALGIMVIAGAANLAWIFALTLASGVATAFDNPTRRAFLQEMVGRELATNAIGLNATVMTSARMVGPLAAGVIITTIGIGWCFVINGLTYLVLVGALVAMRSAELHRLPVIDPAPRQIRDGVRYVLASPRLRTSMLILLLVGTISWGSVEVMIPLVTALVLGAGVTDYTAVFAAMGFGALVGSLVVASRPGSRLADIGATCLVLGAALILAAASINLLWAMVAFAVVGAAGAGFVGTENSFIILETEPRYQGRVLALVSSIQLGSRSIGGLVIGILTAIGGARVAVAVAGALAILAGMVGWAHPGRDHRPDLVPPHADGLEV